MKKRSSPSSTTVFDVSVKRVKLNATATVPPLFTTYRTLPPQQQQSNKTTNAEYGYCATCKLSHAQRDGRGMHPAVAFLLQKGGNEDNQKSDDWLRARCAKATGTFYASCLPKNHSNFNEHTTRTGAFLEKLNLALPFKGNDATRHGERFEDVAIEVYRSLVNNDTVQSFGLLEHPYMPWLGASPDGITNGGIAIEVKCPYFRWLKKDGLYPTYYYPQPQLVMDIAGVELAHFIQFKPPVIRKVKTGTKMVRDRYTHAMKEIATYEKEYEDNVERMLMHGHDKARYIEPLVISVVEVLRNRRFFRENLKHVQSMWNLVTQVYKDNAVVLGDANMTRALHADRMSLPQFVARLHLAFRREGLIPIDYVRLVTDGTTDSLRQMAPVLKALGGREHLTTAVTRFNLEEVLTAELPALGKAYAQHFGETALASLAYTFTKADAPPYYLKARVCASLQKLCLYRGRSQITLALQHDVYRRITLALQLDSPVVDDLVAFCTANDVPFVSVTDEGQTDPVTTRAFDLDKLKPLVKRKGRVPLSEKLLDFEEGSGMRVEPDTIGTTIYYRCGDYAYNPRNLQPTNPRYFGGTAAPPQPRTFATTRRTTYPTAAVSPNATRSIAPGSVTTTTTATTAQQPMDMMALFNAGQKAPSSPTPPPQQQQQQQQQPMDMMALFNASQKRTKPTANMAAMQFNVGTVSHRQPQKVTPSPLQPMDMMAQFQASLK